MKLISVAVCSTVLFIKVPANHLLWKCMNVPGRVILQYKIGYGLGIKKITAMVYSFYWIWCFPIRDDGKFGLTT